MRLSAWRIFKPKHAATAWTGEGARLYGGRWNSNGSAVVYTAGNAPLAALELLVHLASHQVLESYYLCEVTFDESLVEHVRRSSVVLRVPSVIIESEFNFLLNPGHPDFSRVRVGRPRRFRFDPRVLK